MEDIAVSLNPSYLCNFRCDFCYLTHEQLSSKECLSVESIDSILKDIQSHRKIATIDLYGGEPALLSKTYFFSLMSCLLGYTEHINLITNLSTIREHFYHPMLNISVSYDFHAREKHLEVLDNIKTLTSNGIKVSILTLVTPKILKLNIQEMIDTYLSMNIVSVDFKPYSRNQANQLNISYRDYEDFLIRFIKQAKNSGLKIVNEWWIEDALDGIRNSYSDDHVYIAPGGLAVLEFDLNQNEYFKTLGSFEDYIQWTHEEKQKSLSGYCVQCPYLGHCLSEHLKPVTDIENSCNGFYYLLKHFEKERTC